MGLFTRTLLIWLLVLAVPAQAAAAVTMAFCGPNHSAETHAAIAQQRAHDSDANDQPHADGGQAAGHPHAKAQIAEPPSAMAEVDAPVEFDQAGKQKCSACASCCTGAAILSAGLALPAPDIAATVCFATVRSVDAFAVDGPDRPPRILLA